MLELVKRLFVKWLKSRPSTLSVVLDNWSILDYKQTVYNICERDEGFYQIEANLFLNVTGDANTDRVVIVPLAYAFGSAEMAFVFIQSIGPIFNGTGQKVIVINKDMTIRCEWDLTKKVSDQTNFNAEAMMDQVHIMSDKDLEQAVPVKKSEVKQPTHPMNWSVN